MKSRVYENKKLVDKVETKFGIRTIEIRPDEGFFINGKKTVFKVKGAGSYCAGANGDPVSLESFQEPHMKVFNGMMTAIVSSSEEPGEIVLEASSKGLKKGVIVINTQR